MDFAGTSVDLTGPQLIILFHLFQVSVWFSSNSNRSISVDFKWSGVSICIEIVYKKRKMKRGNIFCCITLCSWYTIIKRNRHFQGARRSVLV
jgi:hypothetical protein